MGFDELAAVFDTDRRRERAMLIADRIRGCISDGHRTAMEFGCGTGLVGMQLLDAFEAITFVDASRGMIEQLRAKLGGAPSAIALQMDLLRERPPTAPFDLVFTSMVLHHVPDLGDMLTVLRGLLSAQGRLVIVDLDTDDGRFHAAEPDFQGCDGFDQASFCGLLAGIGFRDISIETFYHGTKRVNGEPVPYSLFMAVADR